MHKLNNYHEILLWNQRFAGGGDVSDAQDVSNYYFDASQNPISMMTNEELMVSNRDTTSMNQSVAYLNQNHHQMQATANLNVTAISMSHMQEQPSFDYKLASAPA